MMDTMGIAGENKEFRSALRQPRSYRGGSVK